MTADGDPIELRLALLKDGRRFILAWGIRMGMGSGATEFLAGDPVLHYAYTTDTFLIALSNFLVVSIPISSAPRT